MTAIATAIAVTTNAAAPRLRPTGYGRRAVWLAMLLAGCGSRVIEVSDAPNWHWSPRLDDESAAARYVRLARQTGGTEHLRKLAEMDRQRPVGQGWLDQCVAQGAEVTWPGGKGLVRADGALIWIQRSGRCGPVLVAEVGQDSSIRLTGVRVAKGELVLAGARSWNEGGDWLEPGEEHQEAWKAVVSLASVLEDTDGDGIPDQTERLLGTSASSRDSDADGVEDGQDPAPLAGPPRTPEQLAVAEALSFVVGFQRKRADGPLRITVPPVAVAAFEGHAGLVLHVGGRLPVSHWLDVKVKSVRRDRATIEVREEHTRGHVLDLALVGGHWRVVDRNVFQIRS